MLKLWGTFKINSSSFLVSQRENLKLTGIRFPFFHALPEIHQVATYLAPIALVEVPCQNRTEILRKLESRSGVIVF